MRRLAERIARHHPEDAVEWVVAIPDPKEEKTATFHVSETIRKNYPNLADELLSKL